MSVEKIDVCINVLGKPCQTALTLLSLLRHSNKYIDRIYCNEESATAPGEARQLESLNKRLGQRFIVFKPPYCHWIRTVDRRRYGEEAVRLSLRYQYGFEHSDKRCLLTIHNDCVFHADVVGPMLEALGSASPSATSAPARAVRPSLPAFATARATWPTAPTYPELAALYAAHDYTTGAYCAPFHLTDFNEKYRSEPWPLPPCRINEWCCLLNLDKARPVTIPVGPATPFGAISDLGDYGIDVGAEWFHDVHRLGFTAGHFPIYDFMTHTGGHAAMSDPGPLPTAGGRGPGTSGGRVRLQSVDFACAVVIPTDTGGEPLATKGRCPLESRWISTCCNFRLPVAGGPYLHLPWASVPAYVAFLWTARTQEGAWTYRIPTVRPVHRQCPPKWPGSTGRGCP